MSGGLRATAMTLAFVAACAHAPKAATPPPAPKLPELKARAPRPPPPAEWYWQSVDPHLHAERRKPLVLPVAERAVVKADGAAKRWAALPPDARARLLREGALVVGSDNESLAKTELSFGAFYSELAEQKVSHLVTFDALMAATRLGLESALAQVEDDLAPAVLTLLTRLETRLESERKGVGATLTEAYRLARGVITVARALAAGDTKANAGKLNDAVEGKAVDPKIAADIATIVTAEKALVEGHAVAATSPVLGVPLDYTRFLVPSAAARPGTYRALAWLGSASFALAARPEHPGAPLGVAQTRASTRAAMLLARACDADVDATTNALYMRLSRYLSFVWGTSDDLTLFDLDEIGTKAGVDLTKPEHVIDVAKVDKVRAGARARPGPALYDGPAGVGRTARVFGGHASPDALALSSLLGPAVGAATAEAPPSLTRDGVRVIPSTLDVAAWLGTPGAKQELREAKADAFERWNGVQPKLAELRSESAMDSWHASVYGSLLAAVATHATAPAEVPERARLEQVLTAWTSIRHLDAPFARPKAAVRTTTPSPGNSTVPVHVEAAPEAIAMLAGAVGQARRGLEALAGLKASALDDVDDLLRIALKAAENRVNDDAAVDASTLPARLAKLEEELGESNASALAVVVAGDPPSRRVLASATGRIEPLYQLVREAGKEDPVLVLGAHLAHHEIVTDAGEAPTDATWRAKAGNAARAAWVGGIGGFRLVSAPNPSGPPSRVSP